MRRLKKIFIIRFMKFIYILTLHILQKRIMINILIG